METIEEIIAMFGGVDGLYVVIANEPFMRLVIEHIGEGPHGLPAISVAHYYEMNGDLCQDPEMCFEIESTQHGTVMHPYMFQMANPPIYQEVSNDAQGIALTEELRQFAATWDRNLRDQGFMQAARQLHSKALM
ncbi:MAG TPA: hypothetical protein VJ731_11690 [Terriglobales bacterium]|nr:hypothetical protein [Terriglobales bacterium]